MGDGGGFAVVPDSMYQLEAGNRQEYASAAYVSLSVEYRIDTTRVARHCDSAASRLPAGSGHPAAGRTGLEQRTRGGERSARATSSRAVRRPGRSAVGPSARGAVSTTSTRTSLRSAGFSAGAVVDGRELARTTATSSTRHLLRRFDERVGEARRGYKPASVRRAATTRRRTWRGATRRPRIHSRYDQAVLRTNARADGVARPQTPGSSPATPDLHLQPARENLYTPTRTATDRPVDDCYWPQLLIYSKCVTERRTPSAPGH